MDSVDSLRTHSPPLKQRSHHPNSYGQEQQPEDHIAYGHCAICALVNSPTYTVRKLGNFEQDGEHYQRQADERTFHVSI
jgi:hypothetical protein